MKKKLLWAALLCTAIAFTACNTGDEDTEAPNVSGVTLNKTTLTVVVGDGELLEYKVSPAEAEDQTVTWSSSDPTVAKVNDRGMVKGVKTGSAIITITTTDGGKTATCNVTVVAELIKVTGITLAPTTAKVEIGKTTTLVATVMPANASDKTVIWKTSDATVATVADGVVTGVKAGSATITATASNGDEATCAVTVDAAAPQSPEYTTAVETSQGIAPTSGDGTEANPYLLASAENLKWMKVQNGSGTGANGGVNTEGKYYKLTTDINVTADEWIAIQKFRGNFDGDNHKITGKLTANAELASFFGFIGSTYSGIVTIKNLKIEAEISAPNTSSVAAVLGSAQNLATGNMSFVISNCSNSGKITGKGYTAGILGSMNFYSFSVASLDHTLLDNCVNTGEVTGEVESVGGIVGSMYVQPKDGIESSAVKFTIKNCRNEGSISSTGIYTGGILGSALFTRSTLIVKSCTNTGVIESEGTPATAEIGEASKFLGTKVGGSPLPRVSIIIE